MYKKKKASKIGKCKSHRSQSWWKLFPTLAMNLSAKDCNPKHESHERLSH